MATACHVERSEAQSRHLAANMARLLRAAGFLRCGLWPPVAMTPVQAKPESTTVWRPLPSRWNRGRNALTRWAGTWDNDTT